MPEALIGVTKLAQTNVRRRRFLEELELAERQSGTTRCLICGKYTRGLIGDGKRWFEEHAERHHDVVVKRHR